MNTIRLKTLRALAAGTAIVALMPGLALAQDAAAAKADEQSADEFGQPIIVTGTLIRGIAPGGSQSISLGGDDITKIGAATTSDLLASVPQAGTFLGFVGVRGTNNFSLAVNRPTLRYLGNTSGSTNSTLLLVDGHRLPGMGILQTTADLDAIAPAAIERVEIVTDGGSSTYGSDAVGGVINFITRKEFDGVQTKASYGFADQYQQLNASVIAGKKWEGGSAYVVYDYSWHDELYGADRDFMQSRDWINNTGANRDCAPGNITAGGITYALPGLTAGLGNRCDLTELQTIYPRERKHSVFGSLVLDSGGPVSFTLKTFYLNRRNNSDGGPLSSAAGVAVPSTSPFFIPVAGATTTETFIYNYSSVFGNSTSQVTNLESWGFTPSVRVELGSRWQMNAEVNYGVGKSTFRGQLINPTPINSAAAAGTFNPANLAAAGNAATLATAKDWFTYGRARNTSSGLRAVFDGPLFALPGGDLRVAFGGEMSKDQYAGNNTRGATAATIAALGNFQKVRTVSSVFGEANIPVVGADNRGFIHGLTLTASGRYDRYSDFGGTFNPKLGATLELTDWLKIRGNWGKAFQAPGLSDLALAAAPSWNNLSVVTRPFTKPGLAPGSTQNNVLVVLGGVKLPLDPQKAQTWSAGFDVRPPVLPGLAFGATYYNIDFKGAIGFPPIFLPATFYSQFPDNYVTFDAGNAAMQAYFNSLAGIATNSTTALAALPSGFNSVYAVIDDRTTNLARIKTSGIDFYARYRTDTGFGSVFADVSGTYITKFDNQANPNAPLLDQTLLDFTKLRLSASLGADVGDLRAQVTWNHSQGYATTPTAANLQQARVGSYNVFNLFFQYNVPADSGAFKDLTFTLNVDNVFDKDPPLFRGARNSTFGIDNGFTLGRLVKVGVSKKF